MNSIKPKPDAVQSLAANPHQGPVVMLNLLKFKRGGGSKAYGRYAEAFLPLLEKCGGRILYAGRADDLLISDETWDAVALVEYPSRRVFLEVTSTQEYREIAALRAEGLERTVLYATTPRPQKVTDQESHHVVSD